MSRQAGGELSKQALEALLNKSDINFDPLPKFNLPDKMTAPSPGKMDTALNVLGTVGAVAGLVPRKQKAGFAPTTGGGGYSPQALGRTITPTRFG